jgi:hypothetical protein
LAKALAVLALLALPILQTNLKIQKNSNNIMINNSMLINNNLIHQNNGINFGKSSRPILSNISSISDGDAGITSHGGIPPTDPPELSKDGNNNDGSGKNYNHILWGALTLAMGGSIHVFGHLIDMEQLEWVGNIGEIGGIVRTGYGIYENFIKK